MSNGYQFIFLVIYWIVIFANRHDVLADSSSKDPGPQFVAAIPNITAVVGSNVTLNCVVDSLGNYQVAWIHTDRHMLLSINGQVITGNPKFKISHYDFRNWSLEIRSINKSDSGEYMCQLMTPLRQHIVGNIEVVETPIISILNQLVKAETGEDVTLVCDLESNPKSVTYWIGGGEEVMIISSSKHKVRLIDKGRYKMQMRLTIRNVGPEDFGSYKCIAKNSKGEAEGTLRLYETPVISIPNQLVGAEIGNDVTLLCNLKTHPMSENYWQRDTNIMTSSSKYKVRTIDKDPYKMQMKLIIKNLQPDDFGSYKCVAKDSNGKTEGTIKLYDIGKEYPISYSSVDRLERNTEKKTLLISVPKKMVGAATGTDVNLDCNLESNPKSMNYWTRDGSQNVIMSSTKYHMRFVETGIYKVQMRLSIKNIRPNDFGSYRCIAKNSHGETEGIITLYEIPKTHTSTYSSIDISAISTEKEPESLEPQFLEVLPNITVVAGSDVTLNCVVDSLGSYKVAWINKNRHILISINDQIITRNPKFKITHDNFRNWSLEIRGISESDSGQYMCQVNTVPFRQIVGNIVVVETPIISTPEELVGAEIATDVTLVCNLESNPKSVTYWSRDGGGFMIISNTKYNSRLIDTGTNKVQMRLLIKDLSLDDFGSYRCIAKNSKGEAEGIIRLYEKPKTHSFTDLSIDISESNTKLKKPVISIPNKLVKAEIGANVRLKCNLESNPRSITYWTRGGELGIISNTKYKIKRLDRGLNKMQMRLIIRNLQPDDFGSYTCVAKNTKGESKGTIRLYEMPKKDSSTYLSADNSGSSIEKKPPILSIPYKVLEVETGEDVTLICNLKSNPKSVTYWTRDDGNIMIIRNTKYSTELIDTGMNEVQMKLLIKNLHPDDFGSYRCIAKNSEGEAEGTIKLYESWKAPSSNYPLSVDSQASNVEKKTPVISVPNKMVEAEIGADVTLVCNLKSNPKSVTYWTREDENIMIIRNKKHITDLVDRGMNEVQMNLIIKNLHPDDFGSYRCIAKNSKGEAEETIKLYESWEAPSSSNSLSVDSQSSGIEKKTPVISIPNNLVRAAIGENAALVCNLKSNPKSVTYWTGVGNEIMIIPDTKYNPILFDFGIDKVQMMLIIKNVGPEDFGSYTCVAKNAKGETEGTIRLEMPETQFTTYSSVHSLAKSTEKKSPIITVPNNLVGAAIGETATLYCNLESNPRSVNYWTRKGEGTLITSSNKYHVSLIDMGVNKVQMRLTINNLRLDDFGSYRCIAKNSKGEGDGTISLYEIRKTDSPKSIIS